MVTSGGGFSGLSRNSGYVITGGTSVRGVIVAAAGDWDDDGGGCDTVVDGKLFVVETLLSWTVFKPSSVEDEVVSSSEASSFCMSSAWRPFFSRNATLRSCEAFFMDSSCKNSRACSKVSSLAAGAAPADSVSSVLSSGIEASGRCQDGMVGILLGFASSPAMSIQNATTT